MFDWPLCWRTVVSNLYYFPLTICPILHMNMWVFGQNTSLDCDLSTYIYSRKRPVALKLNILFVLRVFFISRRCAVSSGTGTYISVCDAIVWYWVSSHLNCYIMPLNSDEFIQADITLDKINSLVKANLVDLAVSLGLTVDPHLKKAVIKKTLGV